MAFGWMEFPKPFPVNVPTQIETSRAGKRYQVLLAVFSLIPIMLRGGWHGEHRQDDARSPAPACIGAAKAAAPRPEPDSCSSQPRNR